MSRATIVSVSKDALLLQTRALLLEQQGYTVESYDEVDDALRRLRSGDHYDLLLIGHTLTKNECALLVSSTARERSDVPIVAIAPPGEIPTQTSGRIIYCEPLPDQLLRAVRNSLPNSLATSA